MLLYGSQRGSIEAPFKAILLALLFILMIGWPVIAFLEKIELKDACLEARRGFNSVRIPKSDIGRVLLPVGKGGIVVELRSGERIELPGIGSDERQGEIKEFINQWLSAA
jgi:hypothetical protein